MNKLLYCFFCAALFLLASCDGILNVDIVGDGNRVFRSRSLSTFSEIYLDAEFEVELKSGATQNVEVVCDSNLMIYVITEVSDNQLSISRKPNFDLFPRQPIQIIITVPNLTSMEVLGGGKVVADTLVLDELSMTVLGVSHISARHLDCTLLDLFAEGSTRVVLNGNFRKLQMQQEGSGEIVLSGTGTTLDISLEGSGKVDAEALQVSFAEIDLYGSGLVFCSTSDLLDVFISGNGRIYYQGNPLTIRQDISGGGLLIQGY